MPKREPHVDDPMELRGVIFPNQDELDLRGMTTSIIEEYMRIGWNAESIVLLFRNPHFRMTNTIYRVKGEKFVRELIEEAMLKRPVR
ncbi:MAG: hypothetical protein ACE5H0_11645 [Bacteroidota bacterium]